MTAPRAASPSAASPTATSPTAASPSAAPPTATSPTAAPPTAKGAARRDALVEAAAAIVVAAGPGALTHRAVAARAGVPLGATTYYFADLADLTGAAGRLLMARWAAHARSVADSGAGGPEALVAAVLPPGDDAAVLGHYEHLLGAARVPALAAAYRAARAELDDAVGRVLAAGGVPRDPAVALAVVDGAAVAALSEGRPVRAHARTVVAAALG